MKKTKLFRDRSGGYALHHIPGIVCLPDQTLLAYCEARRTREFGDWADIDILMRRSRDGGATWLPRQRLAGREGLTSNNPMVIPDAKTGLVHFLHNENYYRCLHQWSADGGMTFSPPVDITYALERLQETRPWNVIAFGPGHGVQLRSGRLILPFWAALGAKTPNGHPRAYNHNHSFTGVLWSDDHGDTWENHAIAAPNLPEHPDPNEAALAELSDGRLMINIRTPASRHRRLCAVSADGGETWGAPYFDEGLFEPVCFAGFCRARDARGEMLLFSNPDSDHLPVVHPRGWRQRKNLSLRLSRDDGRSWSEPKVIEPIGSGYSDLAVDGRGHVFCLYGGGNPADPDAPHGDLTLAELAPRELPSPAGAAADRKTGVEAPELADALA